MSRVKVGGFVAVVIMIECVLAYLYFPTASDVTAKAETKLAGELGKLPPVEEEEPPAVAEERQTAELDLEQFSVTAFQPVSNTTLRIDFHLFATIAKDDEAEFLQRFEQNKHRIRDQVIMTIRSSEVNDLTDAGLGLIKRKILEKTNRALGKPLIQSVIFSDFSFVEQ